MSKFYLIDKNSKVQHEFDAVDLTAARIEMAAWCTANIMKVTLAGALRVGTPSVPASSVTVDDKAA